MSYRVRYIDYPLQFRSIEDEVMETVRRVLGSGELIMRDDMLSFERNLAEFVGTKYAVALSNCTTSLHTCLYAAGIGPGDEIISVAHTFVATISAIHHVGATPVLIDIADDHNMDVDQIEPAITEKTKAILPVSLNGRSAGMDRITEIAERHGMLVVEDAAQALGAVYKGRKPGAWGAAGCFSFYPAKLLGAYGDGGAITTDDESLAEKCRLLRNHGLDTHREVRLWGFNYRMDNLTAAILNLKLSRLPALLDRRREIAALYHEGLEDIEELLLPPAPDSNTDRWDVYQNFEIEAERRDELVGHMTNRGIETMLPWGGKGVHQFEKLGLDFSLPRTEAMFRKVLMIPMFAELTDEQVKTVVSTIRDFYAH